MDSSEGIKAPCFICETKYRAGIFLSKAIAMRKPYADSFICMTEYPDFSEAMKAFLSKYGEIVTRELFRVNELLQVRETNVYIVCYNDNFLCITTREQLSRVVPLNTSYFYTEENLEYEEAQELAKKIIADQTGNNFYCLSGRIKLNIPIRL